MSNKRKFTVEVDGKKIELAVVKPTHKVVQDAELVKMAAYRKAVQSGAMVRDKIEQVMTEQKLWDEARQARFKELTAAVLESEKKILAGGIKKSEAKDIAVDARRKRAELRQLLAKRNELDAQTAESFAERAQFNYLVGACTVYSDTGKPYYKDADDYLNREDDPVALPAAQNMGSLWYGLDDDWESRLPENVFLKNHGFCNDELHLVDKKGRLVDTTGHLVDDKGRLINDKGELVDREGNLLTEDGNYKVESLPFIDDDEESPPTVALV